MRIFLAITLGDVVTQMLSVGPVSSADAALIGGSLAQQILLRHIPNGHVASVNSKPRLVLFRARVVVSSTRQGVSGKAARGVTSAQHAASANMAPPPAAKEITCE